MNQEFLKYILEPTPYTEEVKSLNFYIAPSKLNSKFVSGKDAGLYTGEFIPKGSVFNINHSKLYMNDPMVNLEEFWNVKSGLQLYKALKGLEKNYYNLKLAEKLTNVVMVNTNIGYCYKAIRDISKDSELLRIYGFTTWTCELWDFITVTNLSGYAQFIFDLEDNIGDYDPYISRIRIFSKILRSIFKIPKPVDFAKYHNVHKLDPMHIGEILSTMFYIAIRDSN